MKIMRLLVVIMAFACLLSCKEDKTDIGKVQNKTDTGKAQDETDKLPFRLEKDWTLEGFESPESVVLDADNDVLYVSNVNGEGGVKDGNGYISKVSLTGKFINKKWVDGLNAPKGLVLYNGKLYVTDIDEIIEIDIDSKQKTSFRAEGATFLNDLAIDGEGYVYASNTFGFSAIYRLSKDGDRTVEGWLKDESLNMANGLFVSNNTLYAAGWGTLKGFDSKTFATETNGRLLTIDLTTKAIQQVTNPIGNLDGLSETLHGFLMTDWLAGKLLYYASEAKTTTTALQLVKGSADTYFDKKTKSVFIPLMLDNKVLKYHFK